MSKGLDSNGCDFCGRPFEGLPHRCKYCGQVHCSDHLIPESHECLGLKEYKERSIKKWKDDVVSVSYKQEDIHHNHEWKKPKIKKLKTKEKIKNYFNYKIDSLKYWLNERTHHKYDFHRRSNYIISTILFLAIAIVAFIVFYSNGSKINSIYLWIFKLTGILLLVSGFFTIKYVYRAILELFNFLKRQKNWIKCIIWLILAILIWQVYENKADVLDPAFSIYDKTNFSLFAPISLGNLSILDDGVAYTYNDKSGNQKEGSLKAQSPLKPKIDINALEKEIHNLINQERNKNGLKSLSFDEKLAVVARLHSEDMAENDFFEHDNLKGQDPTDRANSQGYRCHKDFGSYYMDGIAENIFQNNLYDSITYVNGVPFHEWNTQSEIASSTVNGWMNSPGHRQNILTSTYDREGIGVSLSSDDKVYITQDFC